MENLLNKRNKAHADAEAIHKKANEEERDLTPDEQAAFEAAFEDFENYDKQYRQMERLANAEDYTEMDPEQRVAFGAAGIVSGGLETSLEKRTREVIQAEYRKVFVETYFRSRRRVLEDDDFFRTLPKELREDLEQRTAQVIGTDNIGGYLVPEEWAARIIETMKYYGPMLEAGNVFNTANGRPLNIPTEDITNQKGAIIAEDIADSEQLVNWGTKDYGAYMYTSKIIPISLELLQDNDYDVESRVINAAGERIGRILNEHFTTGTGSGQPQGIVTGAGNSSITMVKDVLTIDALLGLEHSVDRAYRSRPKTGWMFHDSTLLALKKLSFSTTNLGFPLWMPSARVGAPDTILGYRYWINNDMQDISTEDQWPILFGDMDAYGIRQVRGINLRRTTERYWERRVVAYNAIARYDALVEDQNAIKKIKTTNS